MVRLALAVRPRRHPFRVGPPQHAPPNAESDLPPPPATAQARVRRLAHRGAPVRAAGGLGIDSHGGSRGRSRGRGGRGGSSSRSSSSDGTRLPPEAPRLEPARALIGRLDLVFDHAPDAEGAHGGPDAPLAPQDPVVEGVARGRLEQADEVFRRDGRDEHHAGAVVDLLVDEEAADARRQEAQRVELAQAVAHLEPDDAEQVARDLHAPLVARRVQQRGAVHVGLEEGDEVRAGLADDEVVDVEQLRDPGERGLAVLVGGVGPWLEAVPWGPGHDVAVDVFAEHGGLPASVERGCRGVGCHCCRPYQLYPMLATLTPPCYDLQQNREKKRKATTSRTTFGAVM